MLLYRLILLLASAAGSDRMHWPPEEYFLPLLKENDTCPHTGFIIADFSASYHATKKDRVPPSQKMRFCAVKDNPNVGLPEGSYCLFAKSCPNQGDIGRTITVTHNVSRNHNAPHTAATSPISNSSEVQYESTITSAHTLSVCCHRSHRGMKPPIWNSFYLIFNKEWCPRENQMPKPKQYSISFKSSDEYQDKRGRNTPIVFCYYSVCPCKHGNCKVTEDGPSCECHSGYSGDLCQIKSKQAKVSTVLAAIGVSGVFVIVAVMLLVWYRKRQRQKKRTRQRRMAVKLPLNQDASHIACEDIPTLGPILTALVDNMTQLRLHSLLIKPNSLELFGRHGQGAFGIVYKGRYTPDDNPRHIQTVAVKISDNSVGTQILMLIDEALTMSDFQHMHVLSIIGIHVKPDSHVPAIVMPFMEHGDLSVYLRKFRYEDADKEAPDQKQLIQFCLQITRGMEYLTNMRFVHRDLAARNCMLNSQLVVKIADFGLARDVYSVSYYRQDNQKLLPVKWMAPESMLDRVFTSRTDVWSFGVTMWEVLTLGTVPYPDLDNINILKYIQAGNRLEKPKLCPDDMFTTMANCWSENPGYRPTFADIGRILSDYLAAVSGYLDLEECTPISSVHSIVNDEPTLPRDERSAMNLLTATSCDCLKADEAPSSGTNPITESIENVSNYVEY